MNILLTGSHGFLVPQLVRYLQSQGHQLHVLYRHEQPNFPNVQTFHWDIEQQTIDPHAFDNIDAIINLAGANIGAQRWTEDRKIQLFKSRVDSTLLLFDNMRALKKRIPIIIQSSAVGIYGAVTKPQHIFDESTPVGDDFLAYLCHEWEAAAALFQKLGSRVVILRKGVVIDQSSTFVQKLLPLVNKHISTQLGDGLQIVPYISLKDLLRLYEFCLSNQDVSGIYNAVNSEIIDNKTMAKQLAQWKGKIVLTPAAPRFFIKSLFGELSSLLLEGTAVSNKKLKACGFQFLNESFTEAL